MSILYKNKGLREDIRNYRPITLLNGDYKILTRILAKRLLRIVTQFVSPAQIGFMPRTLISEATMFIQLMPLFSAVMAIIIFNEKFELYHFAGAAFIVSGIYLSNKKTHD